MGSFNITGALKRLIGDIVRRIGELHHIEPNRLLICVSSTRNGGIHGVYAKIHPLCFAGGVRTTEIRRGRRRCTCSLPTITHRGVEILYLIYFLVPRFLDLPLREKLVTIFHELYHISPEFNGDIRRFAGRNYAHGSSTRRYNQLMGRMVDRYLELIEDRTLLDFLEGNLEDLRTQHGTVVGRKHPVPRLLVVG
ncbi:putative metallopeptidase [Geobacter sp. DSM 9736]|uniref:putative metallopeptidase n=1 Tax=Geobacter sp. DSM 9736 TaxID=1277350 RepID=UPI000B50C6B3|nr:putative metallopeptidase [Geobacter sp. DSM 9736]SNB47881.1 hypothetical protein SAMN06269301_3375 [Geobacter sp. DSM 9736]